MIIHIPTEKTSHQACATIVVMWRSSEILLIITPASLAVLSLRPAWRFSVYAKSGKSKIFKAG